MAVVKKISAIKNSPKHLLGIQNLSILEAKKILRLDEVWWLVTPKNPLKINQPASYKERVKNCKSILTLGESPAASSRRFLLLPLFRTRDGRQLYFFHY